MKLVCILSSTQCTTCMYKIVYLIKLVLTCMYKNNRVLRVCIQLHVTEPLSVVAIKLVEQKAVAIFQEKSLSATAYGGLSDLVKRLV